MERKVDDGSSSSYYNTNGRSDADRHTCLKANCKSDSVGECTVLDPSFDACSYRGTPGHTYGEPDDYTHEVLGLFHPHTCEILPD